MAKKKVLFIAQEIHPYVNESLVGQISKLLPQGIQTGGADIRTFMPSYGTINARRNQLHEVIRLSGMNLVVNDKLHQLIVKVASLQPTRMQVYFIDNDDFFARKGTLRDKDGELYEDNAERAVFFVRGVFETIKQLKWIPDIIHCQGWFSGLAPLYLRTHYKDDPVLSNAKIVFSAYDLTPQKPFGPELTQVLKFDKIDHPLLNGEALDRDALVELILTYIDGMVISTKDISNSLIEAIHSSGKKYLDYHEPEQLVDAVREFYKTLE